MNRELRRIGVEQWDGISGVRVRKHRRESRITFEDSVAEHSLSWQGTVQEALARLRLIAPHNEYEGGTKAFWQALCPEEADAAWRALKDWADLDQRFRDEFRRVDAGGLHLGGGAEWNVGDSADGQRPCTVKEKIVTSIDPGVSGASMDLVERWSGSVEDALDRLAQLPDGAGLLAFWRAFVPELAEEPRVLLEERRRTEGRALERELERLRMNDPELGYTVSVLSRLGTPGGTLTWIAYEERWGATGLKNRKARWSGPAHEALDHLRALADDASVDEVISALS